MQENNEFVFKNARKPVGEMHVVYFSSISENTKKFCEKLGLAASRIPIEESDELNIDQDYVLICPTYAGGLDDFKGCIPKQVVKFLNNKNNRDHCVGVIASGNTNFGDTYAMAGPILSAKLKVPLLWRFELLGTEYDVETVREKISNLWNKVEN